MSLLGKLSGTAIPFDQTTVMSAWAMMIMAVMFVLAWIEG
jgi:hypothetical protein